MVRERYELIDFVRGIALLNMFAYHVLYDLVYIFNQQIPWFRSMGAYYWQQAICVTFILIAGISCHYSKNLYIHGSKVLGAGFIISLVTFMVIPSQFVSFGILHFMGSSMIILAFIKKYLDMLPPRIAMITALVLYVFTKKIPLRYLGVGDIKIIELPNWLYESDYLYGFGFPNNTFSSSDYFPIFPWFLLLLVGYFLWSCIKDHKVIETYGHIEIIGVNAIGKRTLWIYLIHQPLIYCLLLVLKNIKSFIE